VPPLLPPFHTYITCRRALTLPQCTGNKYEGLLSSSILTNWQGTNPHQHVLDPCLSSQGDGNGRRLIIQRCTPYGSMVPDPGARNKVYIKCIKCVLMNLPSHLCDWVAGRCSQLNRFAFERLGVQSIPDYINRCARHGPRSDVSANPSLLRLPLYDSTVVRPHMHSGHESACYRPKVRTNGCINQPAGTAMSRIRRLACPNTHPLATAMPFCFVGRFATMNTNPHCLPLLFAGLHAYTCAAGMHPSSMHSRRDVLARPMVHHVTAVNTEAAQALVKAVGISTGRVPMAG